jgi:hypothetical protein
VEPFGRAPEVQFFGNRYEVSKVTQFYIHIQ